MSDTQIMQRGPTTVSLSDEEGVERVLVGAVGGLWRIVNDLTRLRPTRRERYRVTLFGSPHAKRGNWVYDTVRLLATALADMGCDIVTGGDPDSSSRAPRTCRSPAASLAARK